jgi:hypothetical protein
MTGARVLGVVGGTADNPRVGYLEEPVPASAELLALAGPVQPTEVFRLAAPCVESKCCHFDGHDCRLATRIVQFLSVASESLPACRIRKDCRWFAQERGAACLRCPQVITQNCNPSQDMVRAATPASLLCPEMPG